MFVDLTLELSDGMPTHTMFPSPVVFRYRDHDRDEVAVTYLAMVDHTATHVDAPIHFKAGEATIDEMPLESFTGRAVCLDLRHVPDRGLIDVDVLEAAERAAGLRIQGHIVLLCTGFHRRHWPKPSVMTDYPGLTGPATYWLAERGSKVHGIEGPSTDLIGSTYPSHRACATLGIFHYEWLVNLEELIGVGQFTFAGYPLKIKNGTGSPVRAFAVVEG